MKTRKVPMRKCVACGNSMPKKDLVRIVRTPEHHIFVDPKGKVSGRGAYLCISRTCFELARKKKALSRALEVEITPEMYERLEKEWMDVVHERERSQNS